MLIRIDYCCSAVACACLALTVFSIDLHAQTITTMAGGTGDGLIATAAALSGPRAVASDAEGNLYVVDTYNNVVRKVHAGTSTTVAGVGKEGYAGDGGAAVRAELYHPWGVAVDAAGNLYIADSRNYRIRKVSTNGIITTVAGSGSGQDFGDGGPATSAGLSNPLSVTVDTSGNLYIVDSNRIRKVDPGGTITTVAGNGTVGFSGDGGLAINAEFRYPAAVTVDAAGNLYIADNGNNRVRRVSACGTITTVAGNGGGNAPSDGGPATSADLAEPKGVAVDNNGNLYITTGYNVTRRVAVGGTITTVAGIAYVANDGTCYVLSTACFSGDGGSALEARLYGNTGVTADSAGNLYIADSGNNRVRKISTSGTITTAVGNGTQSYAGDGGAATSAQLLNPAGIAMSGMRDLYIADHDNNVIRKVTPAGTVTTVAGIGPGSNSVFSGGYSGDGGAATSAELNRPSGVAADSVGNLYIADTRNDVIRKVNTSGIITTVAGNGTGGYFGDGGAATSAQLYDPAAVATDAAGNLYIADTSNHRVRKVNAGGTITTVAGNGTEGFSGDGGAATSAQLSGPASVAIDIAGNMYVADFGNARVRRISPSGSITTVAGNGDSGYYGDGGAATSAALWGPRGVAVDVSGNLYIALKESFVVRKVDVGGTITTVAGDGRTWGFSGDGGPATSAQMVQPWGIVVDAVGHLYIADSGNNRIRKVTVNQIFKDGFDLQN